MMFKIHGHRLPCKAPAVCRQREDFLRTQSCRQGRCSSLTTRASIRARWCIDIKYGAKLDAVSLVSEWVQNIGSQAGLSDNVHILSGAVGVPESRIELEVEFETLAELEHFWAAIPAQDHKAWSQRAQHLIIDGSPKWDIYRTVPVSCSSSTSAVASMPQATKAAPAEKSVPAAPAKRDRLLEAATKGGVLLSSNDYTFQAASDHDMEAKQDTGGVEQAEPAGETDPDGRRMVLDWKGDPMYINPGDKMPM